MPPYRTSKLQEKPSVNFHYIFPYFFLFLWVNLALPSWIRIRIPNPDPKHCYQVTYLNIQLQISQFRRPPNAFLFHKSSHVVNTVGIGTVVN